MLQISTFFFFERVKDSLFLPSIICSENNRLSQGKGLFLGALKRKALIMIMVYLDFLQPFEQGRFFFFLFRKRFKIAKYTFLLPRAIVEESIARKNDFFKWFQYKKWSKIGSVPRVVIMLALNKNYI